MPRNMTEKERQYYYERAMQYLKDPDRYLSPANCPPELYFTDPATCFCKRECPPSLYAVELRKIFHQAEYDMQHPQEVELRELEAEISQAMGMQL